MGDDALMVMAAEPCHRAWRYLDNDVKLWFAQLGFDSLRWAMLR